MFETLVISMDILKILIQFKDEKGKNKMFFRIKKNRNNSMKIKLLGEFDEKKRMLIVAYFNQNKNKTYY